MPRWIWRLAFSYVWEEIASLFGLLSVRLAVVVSIKNVLARVQPVFDDPAGYVLGAVVGHSTTTNIVRGTRRRALAGMMEVRCLAVLDFTVMGALLAPPAGTGDAVESFPAGI